MRTLVIGVDGLTTNHLDRQPDTTETLHELAANGVETALESTIPPTPESAWPSLYTGTDPSHHGVFGPTKIPPDPERPVRPVSRVHVRTPAVWDYLSSQGGRSVVVNLPVTSPADPIDGILVPARPDEPGHPSRIREAYTGLCGLSERATDGVTGDTVASIEQQRTALGALLSREPWEFACVRIGRTAEALASADGNRVRRTLASIDRLVESVLESAGDRTTILVCSPFGVAPERGTGRRIHVNEALRRSGFLTTEDERTERSPTPGFRPGSLERPADRGTIGTVKAVIEALVGGERGENDDPSSTVVDVSDALAYCRDGDRFGIRLSVAGREPDGTLPPSAARETAREICDALESLTDPDGKALFSFACAREHLYDGPFREAGPDVYVVPRRPEDRLSAASCDEVLSPADSVTRRERSVFGGGGDPRTTKRSATTDAHRPATTLDGLFIGAGPAVDGGALECRLTVTDVAPIALASLGRPVPDRTTGVVPANLLVDVAERARYVGVSHGLARSDPTFDDARVTDDLGDSGFT